MILAYEEEIGRICATVSKCLEIFDYSDIRKKITDASFRTVPLGCYRDSRLGVLVNEVLCAYLSHGSRYRFVTW